MPRELFRRREHIAQIGMTIAAPAGRADGDEDGIGFLTAFAMSEANESRPAFTLAATTSSSPGSKIGICAGAQGIDLGGILVDADDVVAEFGKTGAGNQSRHNPVPIIAMRMPTPYSAASSNRIALGRLFRNRTFGVRLPRLFGMP